VNDAPALEPWTILATDEDLPWRAIDRRIGRAHKDGDVIVRIRDQPVSSFEELRRALARKRPGDAESLRDGEGHCASATLGARP